MLEISEKAILVLLGGLFGWVLGRLPEKWVYLIAAVSILAALVVFSYG